MKIFNIFKQKKEIDGNILSLYQLLWGSVDTLAVLWGDEYDEYGNLIDNQFFPSYFAEDCCEIALLIKVELRFTGISLFLLSIGKDMELLANVNFLDSYLKCLDDLRDLIKAVQEEKHVLKDDLINLIERFIILSDYFGIISGGGAKFKKILQKDCFLKSSVADSKDFKKMLDYIFQDKKIPYSQIKTFSAKKSFSGFMELTRDIKGNLQGYTISKRKGKLVVRTSGLLPHLSKEQIKKILSLYK